MRRFLPLALAPLLLAPAAAAGTPPGPAVGKDKTAERRAKKEAQEAAFAALRRGEILPLTRIMQIATTRVPGDIIEIEYKAGPRYEVEILSKAGRIIKMKIDARTGEILEMKDD